jgi:Tfp pilus assembly protein PilX
MYNLSRYKAQRGFTLLVAIIFMTVMLSFGLSLSSLAYKQQVLASNAIQSQYAFYTADAALECALYADQQGDVFKFSATGGAPALSCPNMTTEDTILVNRDVGNEWVIKNRVSFDGRCADVWVYKPDGAGETSIFSQGYSVTCAIVDDPGDARFSIRGLKAKYSSGL